MPRLPALTPRKLARALIKVGFLLDHGTGSHDVFYHPRTRRRAVIPGHPKDLPKGALMAILREAGMTKKELANLLR